MTTFVTLGTDIFQTGSTDGYDYTTDHETLTILPSIIVSAQSGFGVYSNYANSVLVNKGNIVSSGNYGIQFEETTSANSSITNAIGALIWGTDGADMDGAGNQIFNNFGKVVATNDDGVYFGSKTQGVVLNNHGSILSADHGVTIASDNTGGTINNFSLIRADVYGVDVDTAPTLTTVINNSTTGIIKGTTDAIYSAQGMFSLTNVGKIIGDIFDGGDLHDVVINHGSIIGVVELQGGNDFFNGTGGTSGPVFGGDGGDHLIGGSHNDLLHGGDGKDLLTGGLGADHFFFDTLPNASTNFDKITDFTPSQHDKIVLSETTDFMNIGAHGTLAAAYFHNGLHAMTANQHILYTKGNGFLYYDQDGNGTTYAPIHFATLFTTPTTHPALTHFDFIVEA